MVVSWGVRCRLAFAIFLACAMGSVQQDAHADDEKNFLVVIDPGHGGNNTGAPGVGGVHEKEFTLALASRLKDILEAADIRVVLTRTDDKFLSLRERTAVANRVGADLFVSLHANASPSHNRRGFETFVLSPEAVAIDAPALRPPGNNRSRMQADSDEISAVLESWQREHSVERAVTLSRMVQKEIEQTRGKKFNRGAKQSSMHVLLGAQMPAVLIEVGFIDHPKEGMELQDPEVQNQLSAAIAKAISKFLATTL